MARGPSKYDEALFSQIRSQKKVVEFLQETISDLVDIQDAVMSQQDQLLRATGDLVNRIQVLEQREEQRRKFRIIK
jgi:hypothetical protein